MRARVIAHFLTCRTLGHAWHVVPADGPSPFGDPFWIRCERCNTERHDGVSYTTGEVVSRRYVYPDGYQHAFDTNFADAAPTRNDFRRMLLEAHVNRVRGDRQAQRESNGKKPR